MASEPMTHDYTRRHWGHDYTIHDTGGDGMRLHLSGWGGRIQEGDYLLLQNGSGSTRYRIESIRYELAPRDMWHGIAVFAPRTD